MQAEDPLDMGADGECGEELVCEVLCADEERAGAREWEEDGHGVYLCPEANQDCFCGLKQDDGASGGEGLLAWDVFPVRELEERAHDEYEVRVRESALWSAACGGVCELGAGLY